MRVEQQGGIYLFNSRQLNTTKLNSPGINTANTAVKSTLSITSAVNVPAKSTVAVMSDAGVRAGSVVNVALEVNTPAKSTANVSSDASTGLSSKVNILKLIEIYLLMSSREFEIKAVVGGLTYDDTKVVEFDIEDSIIPSEDFTLGAVISSKLTLLLRTADTIPANASIAPYVRLNGVMGPTEWIALGMYSVDTRGFQNNVWAFTCYDKLILSQQTYVSALIYPATMAAVFTELCGQLGLTADSSIVINPAYMIPYKDLDITMHDVLGYIASAHGASVRLTKDTGKIAFVKFPPTAAKIPILASDYFKVQQTNPLKTYTAICLTYNTDGETLTAGIGDADHTLNIYNPFMDQAILNSVLAEINGLSYMPFTMEWKGNPTIDIGAAIIVTQRDGTTFPSILLTNKTSYKGGLKATVTAPSYSPQRSETDYKGGLKQYVNTQVAKALQPDKPYYGVTIGQANGLKIVRSDGVSEATFNSDTLNMKRNGANIFDVNSDGWLELTGVIINGGTITWGVGGVNPPTAAQVGALPAGWTPDLSAYVTSGALSTTLTNYLTDSEFSTQIGQDYIVTGKIAANQIAVGTLNGFTLIGVDITAKSVLKVSSNIYYASGSLYGMQFGDIVSGYSDPATLKYFQSNIGESNLQLVAPLFLISAPTTVQSSLYVTGNLTVNGTISGTVGYANSAGTAIALSGQNPGIGSTGCYANTAGGDFRLVTGNGGYLKITATSISYINSSGVERAL